MSSNATAPFGTLNRDQIFCLAAWLVHTRGNYKSEADAVVGAVLAKLVSCFPEDPDDPPFGVLHRRLARACSPESIRQFLLGLYRSAQVGEGLRGSSDDPSWAYARCWSEVEAIMTEVPNRPWTATPPNPWLHKVTPEFAWAALRRLSAPLDHRGSADQVKDDELAIKAVIGRWKRLETWRNWVICCPACSTQIPLLRDPGHISRCHCHPAHRRLAAAQKALGLVKAPSGGSAELALESKPRFPTYISDYEVEKTLAKLVQRKPGDALPDLTDLESVLTEWEHSRPDYKFVCPDCKESPEIRNVPKHLMICLRHPAAAKAAELEQELQARSGAGTEVLLALTAERESFRSMLGRLAHATEVFAENLHWSRDGLYSKPIDEGPWRALQEQAQELLGYAPRVWPPASKEDKEEEFQTGRAYELYNLLLRIVGKRARPLVSPQLDIYRPPEDPNQSLNEEVKELREMIAEWRRLRAYFVNVGCAPDFKPLKGPTATFECPACHRTGIRPEGLLHHLVRCRLMPANARARAAVAELRAIGKIDDPTHFFALPIEELDPTELRRGDGLQNFDVFLERWSADAVQTIERLARGEPPGPRDEGTLLYFLREWDGLKAALENRCPGCAEPISLANIGVHMMDCAQLHAASFARRAEEELLRPARGSSPLPVASLQTESDTYALGLARLVEANRAYWNAMGDLEGGRSLQDERHVPGWEAARAAARILLDSSGGNR